MLAFKKAQKACDEKLAEVVKELDGWGYGAIPWEVDYPSAQKLEGKNGNYRYQQEIGNNETALLYLIDTGIRDIRTMIYSTIWKDTLGQEVYKQTVKKVFITFDDKGTKGNGIDHDYDLKDGVLTVICHLDFTQNVGQSLKSDPAKLKLLPILDNLVQWCWQLETKNVKSNVDWFGPRIKTALPNSEWSLDVDGTRKVTGHGKDYYGMPLAYNAEVLKYLHSNFLNGTTQAIEKVCSDEIGKEAMGETFKKVIIHGDNNGKGKLEVEISKEGDTLHITAHCDFAKEPSPNYPDSGAMAKQIEALLG